MSVCVDDSKAQWFAFLAKFIQKCLIVQVFIPKSILSNRKEIRIKLHNSGPYHFMSHGIL
jgi:hypothetical protein